MSPTARTLRDSSAALARRLAVALAAMLVAAGCAQETQRDKVIILVVDGLRPDYVTAEIMPNLNALAESGVRGLAHHAVFPTVTRVNGPSIVTGRNPGGHGLLGNTYYLPGVDSTRTLDMSDAADLRLIDQATGGRLLTAPTIGEMLAEQGLTFFAASSGSTGSAMLLNHRGAGAGLVHHELTIPDSLGRVVAEVLGPVPEVPFGASSVPLVTRAIDALLLIGLDRADADVAAAWLTEPDGTAHARGIGAPETLEVLAGVDAEIARLIDGLEARGLRERTNILVTSDHGFTTYVGSTSLTNLLVQAGLKESVRSTDVVVAGYAIWVRRGGEQRTRRIVELLQRTDWVGPVFMRAGAADPDQGRLPGTLSFGVIGWDHERSADILISPQWTDEENEFGYRGTVLSPGTAGHGSASPWDIRATFVAAGPAIKSGVASDIPTGNVDLTPTALRLVGAEIPAGLDGRVLEEVLVGGPHPASLAGEGAVVQTSTVAGGLTYDATVYRSGIGGSTYFDGTDVTRTRAQGLQQASGPVVVVYDDIVDGFYSEEVPFPASGDWLGLFLDGENAELRRVSVTWDTFREDDFVEHRLAIDPPEPTLLVGGVDRLAPGAARSGTEFTVSLLANDPELVVRLGSRQWTFRLTASDELGCDGRLTLSDGTRTQLLYDVAGDGFCDEPRFDINWAGDLDGDGRLDFVGTFSPKYSVYPRRLYLSSIAGPGELAGEVAVYERLAM